MAEIRSSEQKLTRQSPVDALIVVGTGAWQGKAALLRRGLYYIEDVVAFSERELLAMKGMGHACLNALRKELARHGLYLAGEKPSTVVPPFVPVLVASPQEVLVETTGIEETPKGTFESLISTGDHSACQVYGQIPELICDECFEINSRDEVLKLEAQLEDILRDFTNEVHSPKVDPAVLQEQAKALYNLRCRINNSQKRRLTERE